MITMMLYGVAAFLAGVVTFAAPCTLPVLPAYVAFSSKTTKGNAKMQTLCFALGLSLVLALMGVFAASLGKLILNYKIEMIYVFASLIMLFGLVSITGFKLPTFFGSKQKHASGNNLGSFLFGSTFALMWSGCIGPVLGIILILAATTRTALGGGLLLFIYGLGLMFPLFIFSTYIDGLPKDGRFWTVLKGKIFTIKIKRKNFYFHSTNLISGILFIAVGLLLIFEAKYSLTKYMFPELTELVFIGQNMLLEWFKL